VAVPNPEVTLPALQEGFIEEPFVEVPFIEEPMAGVQTILIQQDLL
jgi:hypothetical protein